MSIKKVGVVVVTYNRLKLLQEVISALRTQTYTNYQIIVINNGSTDNTAIWLNKQKDIITITQDNIGGAGGFFTGMKYVAEAGFEYCWIMDDDVICQSDALEELITAYTARPNIGFVCSHVIGIDGNPMNTPEPAPNDMRKGYPNTFTLVKEYGMVKVVSATFVSVFLSTSTIFEIGLPYKEYFIWGDDSEYTQRISERYDSYIACKSIVVHKRSIQQPLNYLDETDNARLKNYYYLFRNQIHTKIKHKQYTKLAIGLMGRLKLVIKAFVQCRFKQFVILLKGHFSIFIFHPQIQYPQKNEN